MKIKIKYRLITEGCEPFNHDAGDWIDLKSAETVTFVAPQAGVRKRETIDGEVVSHRDVKFDTKLVDLGVAMELPKGFEAQILPRSSSPKMGYIQPNSEGVIDNIYKGNDDQWRYWVTALKDTTINKGDRICQFRIQLSQKATVWQKIKWFFSSGVELVRVDELKGKNRGGYGTTGRQ